MLLCHIAQRCAADLPQPEKETTDVRVAAQVAKVLRCHKRPVVFFVDEGAVVDGISLHVVIRQPVHHGTLTGRSATGLIEQIDQRRSLRTEINA